MGLGFGRFVIDLKSQSFNIAFAGFCIFLRTLLIIL